MLAALAATPAAAQEAPRTLDGHRFCSGDGMGVSEVGDGTFRAGMSLSFVGDVANAVYPAEGQKLFAPHETLKSYVTVYYRFPIGADGNPRGRPTPDQISISTGRFAVPRLEPMESLALRLKAGEVLSPPVEINFAFYNIAIVAGEFGATDSNAPYDTEMPPADFDKLAMALEGPEKWLLLSQDGREVARIPVSQVSVAGQRDKQIAWIRKTLPLLMQGKCG
jgi:hypothetical protein